MTVMKNVSFLFFFFFLQKTDITQPALETLVKSQVRRVLIVGRRGPMQVACTIKVGVRRESFFKKGITTVSDVYLKKESTVVSQLSLSSCFVNMIPTPL